MFKVFFQGKLAQLSRKRVGPSRKAQASRNCTYARRVTHVAKRVFEKVCHP